MNTTSVSTGEVGQNGTPVDFEDVRSVEAFLYREADLIDTGRLNDWLELFSSDCRYVVPYGTIGEVRRLSLINDDAVRLRERVARIVSGASFTQSPMTRVFHSVTNVRVEQIGEDTWCVSSNQLIVTFRKGEQQLFATVCEHHIRLDAGVPLIFKKIVSLLNQDQPLREMTFVL